MNDSEGQELLHRDMIDRSSRAVARREKLLSTARDLFIENGFHGTGIAQIAAASGIGVGQIYRDFEGKEAIIAAICEADVTDWLEEDALSAGVAARDLPAIRAWIGRFVDADEPDEECRLLTEVIAEAGRNRRIAELHQGIDARVRTSLSAALSALVGPRHGDRELTMLVEFILAAGIGVMARRVVNPDLPPDQLGRFLGELLDRELARLEP